MGAPCNSGARCGYQGPRDRRDSRPGIILEGVAADTRPVSGQQRCCWITADQPGTRRWPSLCCITAASAQTGEGGNLLVRKTALAEQQWTVFGGADGIASPSPLDVAVTSAIAMQQLRGTGATKVALHEQTNGARCASLFGMKVWLFDTFSQPSPAFRQRCRHHGTSSAPLRFFRSPQPRTVAAPASLLLPWCRPALPCAPDLPRPPCLALHHLLTCASSSALLPWFPLLLRLRTGCERVAIHVIDRASGEDPDSSTVCSTMCLSGQRCATPAERVPTPVL